MSDTPTHCDECDPSFGCFAAGTPCSKRPPDAQTPRTEEELSDWGHCEPGFFAGKGQTYVRVEFARQLEREVDDLRRKLAEAQENLIACRDTREKLGDKWMAAEADAREAREDASKAAKDAVRYANELAAERAIPRACRALEQDEVGAPCSYLRDAEAALAAERAAREAAEEDAQRRENDLRYSYQVACERQAKAEQQRDAWEKRAGQYMDERDAAADLAREECAKHCESHARTDQSVTHTAFNHLLMEARELRSTIADPAAVKRTLEDAEMFQWILAHLEDTEDFLLAVLSRPEYDAAKDGFIAAINAARKGEEGKS